MKKIVFSIILCLLVGFSSFAQEFYGETPVLTNKRGTAILPKAGDFAVGIDASTPLRYAGSIFSNVSNSAPVFDGFNGNIYGKYFLQDQRALRARVTLDLSNTDRKAFVRDNDYPSETNFTLQDVEKRFEAKVDLSVGYEVRRGSGRFQGFFGGEGILGVTAETYKYQYANSFKTATMPYSFSFGNNNISSEGRMITYKKSPKYSIAAGGFVGVEYFIAPKFSIGGEFFLRIKFALAGKSETTRESWNVANSKSEIKTTKGTDAREALSVKIYTKDEKLSSFFLLFHF